MAARCPDSQMTAIGLVGSSPAGIPSMSCQAVKAEPGMWPAFHSRSSRTSRIWTVRIFVGAADQLLDR